MKKVLLIINPVSGKLRARDSLFDIIEKFSAHGILPTIQLTQKRDHAITIARDAALSGQYDAIYCCGGDGTLNEVIAGVITSQKRIPIGYIPAGTTNDFATGLGIPLKLPAATSAASESLKKGRTFSIDVGRFGKDKFFTYIASFGAFTSSSYNAPQNVKNVLGHMAYVFEGVKDFFQIKPIHAVCTTPDGTRYEDDYAFGAVTNTFSVGGIVKLGENMVNINDGEFEILLVRMPKNTTEFNHIVNAVISSNLQNNEMIKFFRASSVTFEMPAGVQWSLDGEQADGSGTVTIKNIHSAIDLLK